MTANTLTCSLNFYEFSIDFDVNIDSSVMESEAYCLSSEASFTFAVADTWLRTKDCRHLLVSEFHTGNLVELLSTLERRLTVESLASGIENVIECCGWGAWMHGYWDRLNNDSSKINDDSIYDLLIRLSLMEGQEGHVAAYKYKGVAVIEVATRPKTGVPVFMCSEFESAELVKNMADIKALVVKAIKERQSELGKS